MKYSVEIKNGIAKETLVFNGKQYTRTTKKTDFGSCSTDMDFCEQIEIGELTDDMLDLVEDALDGFLADKLLDIAESEG